MKIDQTVESHDDLLKVVDNLLGEAGLDRGDGLVQVVAIQRQAGFEAQGIPRAQADGLGDLLGHRADAHADAGGHIDGRGGVRRRIHDRARCVQGGAVRGIRRAADHRSLR